MASVQMKAGMFAMQPAPQLGFSLFR